MKMTIETSSEQALTVERFYTTEATAAVKLVKGQIDAIKALWPEAYSALYLTAVPEKKRGK